MKRWSLEDLEQMSTHELSDFLTTLATILQQLPDVPLTEIKPESGSGQAIGTRGLLEKLNREPRQVLEGDSSHE